MSRMFSTVLLKSLALTILGGAFASTAAAQDSGLSVGARQQIEALMEEKASRTPAQRKISSHLLYEMKRRRGDRLLSAAPSLRSGVEVDSAGSTLVDIKGEVSERLRRRIEELGGSVVSAVPRFQAMRARIPVMALEDLATDSEILSIRPAGKALTNKVNTSQGDVAHGAELARAALSFDGTGSKVCVLSNSVDHLAAVQASGDLPASIDILPGQDGLGLGLSGEGTAMLEIVHDLAPGAQLGFATAWLGEASFAQNILDLRAVAGCDVIVDDIIYLEEPVFQDGIIAQAVDSVVADGAVYFSSAGNFGNQNDGTSTVWEGDFVDSGVSGSGSLPPGNTHDFGDGVISNRVLGSTSYVTLQWSDPSAASANDYDLCVLNEALSQVFECSTNTQDGTGDPFEVLLSGAFFGERLVIINRNNAAEPRYLHLNALWAPLTVATPGQTWGHSAAEGALSVAAVDWRETCGNKSCRFQGTESVEGFSSDGPRRIFFEADGTAITPGNVSSTGGELRQKPDIAAADGVATATPGFGNFFGTSAAAPHAAAIAGLLLSKDPSLTPAQIRSLLATTALDIEGPGVDRDSGFGIVDAFEALGGAPPPVAGPGVPLDFTADSMADILWRNAGNWKTVLWRMNGFEKDASATIGTVSGDWVVEDIGDFDGDGNADILWRNKASGSTAIWQMNAFVKGASASIGTVSGIWKVAGVGDFDGGGQADILWHNSATGNTILWQMDGLIKVAAASIGTPSLDWQIVGVNDFSGDGKSDILWRNASNGDTVIWEMDGFTKTAAASIGVVSGVWLVESTGDFDGAGQADILWRNADTGGTVIWQMTGFTKAASAQIGTVGSVWQVARVGDYNGDGQDDILWRNPGSGGTIIWQMSGLTKEIAQAVASVSSAWDVE